MTGANLARLAIVVAVDAYSNSSNNLPGCAQDGAAMVEVLKHTSRFDEILFLSGAVETASNHLKARISEFADKYRSNSIEEIIFYFSGHGEFHGGEFRYVFLRPFVIVT